MKLYAHFAPLAERYGGFILDLWGVIHDGHAAYPGAAACLAALKGAGGRAVLLSNAPRRAWAIEAAMERMGIARDLYLGVVSSGEAVYQELLTRKDPWYAKLGPRCYHLGPERDNNMLEGLDLELTGPERADFILNTGPWELDETVADYEDVMRLGAERGIPMVCANPDLVVMREGMRVVCAGALAARYEELGGEVSYRGKPRPEIYADCFRMLGIEDRGRILAVGDSLRTDIEGARAAGLDSALVTGGIHAQELGIHEGEMPALAAVEALCARHGLKPVAALPAFIW